MFASKTLGCHLDDHQILLVRHSAYGWHPRQCVYRSVNILPFDISSDNSTNLERYNVQTLKFLSSCYFYGNASMRFSSQCFSIINCIQKVSLMTFKKLEVQSNLFFQEKFSIQKVADFILCKFIPNLLPKPQTFLCLTAFYPIGSRLRNAICNGTQLKAVTVTMTNAHENFKLYNPHYPRGIHAVVDRSVKKRNSGS